MITIEEVNADLDRIGGMNGVVPVANPATAPEPLRVTVEIQRRGSPRGRCGGFYEVYVGKRRVQFFSNPRQKGFVEAYADKIGAAVLRSAFEEVFP